MTETTPQDRRRSERITARIQVFVRLEMAGETPVEVQAFTQTLNAHGGLLEMPLKLPPNENFILINAQTRKGVGCRVVRAEEKSQAPYPTAFEFAEPSPRFWPITNPPADWGLTKT
jgi:hypothetical protein